MNNESAMQKLWLFISSAWPRMSEAYGDIGGGTYKVWAGTLADDDVADGLRKLVKEMPKWPPSLPEFRDMCRGKQALPANDEDMRKWAIEAGLGDARPQESWQQYRARLESVIERTADAGQRLLT